MAIFHGSILSVSLGRSVPICAIVPAGGFAAIMGQPKPAGPFKTLYLLHGIGGDQTDWLYGSTIAAQAEAARIAVIMPAGENSFYVDAPGGANYSRFIGDELVTATRGIFNLSDRREDTFIAGLSMGGYGALHNGLKHGGRFGGAAALSAALVVGQPEIYSEDDSFPFLRPSYHERTFGDLAKIAGSEFDLSALARERKLQGNLPRLFMACGTEDSLLGANRKYRDFLVSEGIDVMYEEGPGGHDWKFWDTIIARVLAWMS
jgi:putative tributyrin esterase